MSLAWLSLSPATKRMTLHPIHVGKEPNGSYFNCSESGDIPCQLYFLCNESLKVDWGLTAPMLLRRWWRGRLWGRWLGSVVGLFADAEHFLEEVAVWLAVAVCAAGA